MGKLSGQARWLSAKNPKSSAPTVSDETLVKLDLSVNYGTTPIPEFSGASAVALAKAEGL